MRIFESGYWPLWIVAVVLVVAAVQNARTLIVRNSLSFPAILGGLLCALLVVARFVPSTQGGDLWSSLAATFAGFVTVFVLYAIGGIGAGNVKMQMAYGAWVGATFPTQPAVALAVAGTVLGLVLAGLWASVRNMRYRKLLRQLHEEGEEIPPHLMLIAGQVPLSLGSILTLICAIEWHWV